MIPLEFRPFLDDPSIIVPLHISLDPLIISVARIVHASASRAMTERWKYQRQALGIRGRKKGSKNRITINRSGGDSGLGRLACLLLVCLSPWWLAGRLGE